jgi:hypothetical protein
MAMCWCPSTVGDFCHFFFRLGIFRGPAHFFCRLDFPFRKGGEVPSVDQPTRDPYPLKCAEDGGRRSGAEDRGSESLSGRCDTAWKCSRCMEMCIFNCIFLKG